MISNIRSLSARYMSRCKKRSLLTIIAVILSTALITGVGTIIKSLEQTMIQRTINLTGNYHIALDGITDEQAETVSTHVRVESSCRIINLGYGSLTRTFLASSEAAELKPLYLRLSSYDENATEMLGLGNRIISGRLPRTPDEIAVSSRTAKVLGNDEIIGTVIEIPVGKRILVSDNSVITEKPYPFTDDDGNTAEEVFIPEFMKAYRITGITETPMYDTADFAHDALLSHSSKNPPDAGPGRLLLRLGELDDLKETAGRISADTGIPPAAFEYNEQLLYFYGRGLDDNLNDSLWRFKLLIIMIIVLSTVAVIYNSFNISLSERIRQFGIIRISGASAADIRRIIYWEAALVCLAAVPAGILLGLYAMKIVFVLSGLLGSNLFFKEIDVVISAEVVLSSALISLGTIFLSALLPALKAGRIPPIEAVRGDSMMTKDLPVNSGLLKWKLSALPLAVQLAVKNIIRNRKQFAVTLSSLVISMALYLGFSGTLDLLEATNIIDEPGQPGFVLSNDSGIDRAMVHEISKLDTVDIVYKYMTADAELVIREDKLSEYYRENVEEMTEFKRDGKNAVIPGSRVISIGDSALSEMEPALLDEASGDGIILVTDALFLNKSGIKAFAPNSSMKAGDRIGVKMSGGPDLEFEITSLLTKALYDDYNENEGGIDIIVTEEQFRRISGQAESADLYIKLEEGSDKSELVRHLDALSAQDPGYSYIDVQSYSEKLSKDFRVFELFFYGFMLIIILIGGTNVANTMYTNLMLRMREIGLLQTAGMDRAGIRLMLLSEQSVYCLFTLILGGAAGVFLRFLLIRTAGSFRETIFIMPAEELLIAFLVITAISLAATAGAVRKVFRTSIIEKTRVPE